MKRSSLVAATLLFAALFAVIGALTIFKVRAVRAASAAGPAYEPAEAVDIVEATTISWQPTADLVGTVIAVRSVMVRNEPAGVITEVGFESGSIIEAGQPVIRLNATVERADLEAAKANVRVAEAGVTQADSRVALAQKELERRASVGVERAVAEVEIDRARAELDTARADRLQKLAEVDQAIARVAQFEARLAKFMIPAPFRARAGMRMVHEGQYLAEGADVVALQEVTDTIYLDFAIPQEYGPRVRPGVAVMATGELLGPEPVRIEVVAADATVNNNTRNLRVRAVVDNREGRLSPGMFIQIRVPVDVAKEHIAVPGTAVRRASHADSVFVLAPGEAPDTFRATQRFVRLGPSVGDQVIVLEGLEAGERLASTGSFKLRDSALVSAAKPAPPPDAAPAPAPSASTFSRE